MRNLTLLAPGILGPDDDAGTALHALKRLLARADTRPGYGRMLHELLFRLFAVNVPPQQDLPVAAVTRHQDGGAPDDNWWYRADPVYCYPDRDRVLLMASGSLPITQEEADHLVAELNELVAANDWQFQALTPHRWYLRTPPSPQVHTVALPLVTGHNIFPHLPRSNERRVWQALLTEIQMLLHASPVNARRLSRGQLPINNLWLWAGGRMPAVAQRCFAAVWSREPVALGLAQLAGVPSHPGIPDGRAWLDALTADGELLIVLGEECDALSDSGGEQWLCRAAEINGVWLEPLTEALRCGQLDRLRFWTGTDVFYEIDAGRLRRWWRRTRPLRSYW